MKVFLFDGNGYLSEQGAVELYDAWRITKEGQIWIDCDGNDITEVERVLDELGVHPLSIQDVLRKRHQPKFEAFDQYCFFIVRGLSPDAEDVIFDPIQLALVISEKWMLTCHYTPSPSIQRVSLEVENSNDSYSIGSLTHAVLTTVSGRYLNMMLAFEDRVVEMEDQMLTDPSDKLMNDIISHKTSLRKLKRGLLYHERLSLQAKHKGVIGHLAADGPELNDIYEKWERLHSMSAMYYDQLGDLIDGYISTTSHKLNNTMRVLTVITAIFVPLSFLAGLYGMNFDNMPELHHPYGYPALIGVMFLTALSLIVVFRKNRWL